MPVLIETLRYAHIIAGFISLVLFWVPIFTRKGGKNHRQVGKLYVGFMWVVVVTAALLSVNNFWIGRYTMGAFLGFIVLITANPLWYGVAVLKHKSGLTDTYRRIHLLFRIAIVLAGIALISYGIALKGQGAAVLMFIFGGAGLTDLVGVVKHIKTPPQQAQWFKDHLIGMCTSGIAAYTAFLVFGANQFLAGWLPGLWAVIPWVAPGIIGGWGIRMTVKRYQKSGQIA